MRILKDAETSTPFVTLPQIFTEKKKSTNGTNLNTNKIYSKREQKIDTIRELGDQPQIKEGTPINHKYDAKLGLNHLHQQNFLLEQYNE